MQRHETETNSTTEAPLEQSIEGSGEVDLPACFRGDSLVLRDFDLIAIADGERQCAADSSLTSKRAS